MASPSVSSYSKSDTTFFFVSSSPSDSPFRIAQPRPEDFPVQPCVVTGFKLMPNGFFDVNPTLDLPSDRNQKSCHAIAAE
jgi:hypothetical protein